MLWIRHAELDSVSHIKFDDETLSQAQCDVGRIFNRFRFSTT